MYRDFEELKLKVGAAQAKTIVVAAAHDVHTLEAVYAATEELSLKYILVGDKEKILSISKGLGHTPEINSIVDVNASDNVSCAKEAVALIRQGAGNVLMKGILETGTLLKAVLDKETGIRESETMSHLAVLEVPGLTKLVSITDGGMCPYPNLSQKADIVRNAVTFYSRLGFNCPNVAVLAAAEAVSPKMPETTDAFELREMCAHGELANCVLEGPLSFDIAVSPEAAGIKGVKSAISGDVDIFLVPNIATGNILCKSLIYWANAKMAGVVLGALTPIILVSRGASALEKLLSIMLAVS